MTWIKMEHVYNEYPLDRDVYTFPPNLPFPFLPNAAYYGYFFFFFSLSPPFPPSTPLISEF